MELIGADVSALVLDAGSWSTKFGYAGEAAPHVDFRTSLFQGGSGLPPAKRKKTEGGSKPVKARHVIGSNNLKRIPNVDVITPMNLGIVHDWDAMEVVWKHAYKTLGVSSEEHPLLISESTWNSRQNREKQLELAFETFKTPAFFAAKDASLACFSSGRGTGLVINCGHQSTTIVPVHDGHCLLEPRFRTRVAGDYLTHGLESAMKKRQVFVKPRCLIENDDKTGLTESFLTFCRQDVIADVKRSVLAVAKDPTSGIKISGKTYELPDGHRITFNNKHRVGLTENLFIMRNENPNSNLNLDGYNFEGLPTMMRSSLSKIDPDARKDIAGSVILVGGTSALPGFRERIAMELERFSHALKPKIATPVRSVAGYREEFGIWLGGSILASLGFFQTFWIYPQEYEDEGKRVIHRKCP